MTRIVRVSTFVDGDLLGRSPIDEKQLENHVRHILIQQLAHTLYDTEVKTRPSVCGTAYYIELNIISNNELEILERAMK